MEKAKKKKSIKKADKKVSKKAKHKCKKAVDQRRYGKYGILKECDYHVKRNCFETWLREVKKIEVNELNRQSDIMGYFRDYMEDYNTATLPHTKYYDIEKYEKKKYGLRKEKDDPVKKRSTMPLMDKEKIAAMKKQRDLINQMQNYYKSGHVEEARKIEALLKVKQDTFMIVENTGSSQGF